MSPEIEEAIESARTSCGGDKRPHDRNMLVRILLSIIRELPDDLSVRDLREELEE